MNFVAGTMVLIFSVLLPFFWLAVWRRKNWARWVLLLAFAISVPFQFVNPSGIKFGLPLEVVSTFSTAIEALAFVFIFTGDARPWFHKPS